MNIILNSFNSGDYSIKMACKFEEEKMDTELFWLILSLLFQNWSYSYFTGGEKKHWTWKRIGQLQWYQEKGGQPWVIIHFGIREKVIENKFQFKEKQMTLKLIVAIDLDYFKRLETTRKRLHVCLNILLIIFWVYLWRNK